MMHKQTKLCAFIHFGLILFNIININMFFVWGPRGVFTGRPHNPNQQQHIFLLLLLLILKLFMCKDEYYLVCYLFVVCMNFVECDCVSTREGTEGDVRPSVCLLHDGSLL